MLVDISDISDNNCVHTLEANERLFFTPHQNISSDICNVGIFVLIFFVFLQRLYYQIRCVLHDKCTTLGAQKEFIALLFGSLFRILFLSPKIPKHNITSSHEHFIRIPVNNASAENNAVDGQEIVFFFLWIFFSDDFQIHFGLYAYFLLIKIVLIVSI